jgi:hypothetical protein
LQQEKGKMPRPSEIPATEPALATTPLVLSVEQLQQLLAAAGASNKTDDKFADLVQAIVESRKPYRDPKQELNDLEFQKSNREQEENKRRLTKNSHDNCPHEKGANGNRSFGESAFWKLRLDTGETIGICSQCGKEISSLYPEHMVFFRKRGDNLDASAGQRQFMDPLKAMTARLAPEERQKVKERLLQGV